jgi:hypothetical protein
MLEKLGAVKDVEVCRNLLWNIEEKMNNLVALHSDGELLRRWYFLHLLTLHS